MDFKKIVWIYSELIKWKQTLLLVFTAVFAYLISAKATTFVFKDFAFLFISIFICISGTTILNMYVDHDIDQIMERTKNRPIPKGEVPLSVVLINGIAITAIGLLLASIFLDWLTTLLIFLGFFFDFVIYSIWLKRRTKYSIIFGGVAGGLPAMAGRVFAIGYIDHIAFYFLFFILTWIPVHILTLAMFPHNLKGYEEAKVPMWPVVSSEMETMRVIAVSTLINAVVTFLIACFIDTNLVVRFIILAVCVTLGILVIEDLIKPSQKKTFRIFKFASMFMVLSFLLLYLGVLIE